MLNTFGTSMIWGDSMRMRFSAHRHQSVRGFTLTELAIVMGIIGLILGAIWVAAAQVSSSNKLQSAQQTTSFIISNFKTVYGTKGIDFAGGDVTCSGVNNNYFPPNAVRPGCTTGSYTSTYPLNPWSGYIRVDADNATQGIMVTMTNLPQDACIKFATSFPNTGDIISVKINANAAITVLPVTIAAASGVNGCVAGTNTVVVNYKAR